MLNGGLALAKEAFSLVFDVFGLVLELPEYVSHLGEELFDLPHGVQLFDVFHFSLQVVESQLLHGILLFRGVGVVLHFALVGQGVVHGELLLEVSDFLFELFKQELRVLLDVDDRLIADLHHARGELQSGNGFFNVLRLRVYVGDHDGLAVAANGVLEEVGKLALPVGDVVSLVVADGDHHLLQEGEGLVDVRGFLQVDALGA